MMYMRDFQKIIADVKFRNWKLDVKYDIAGGNAGEYRSTRCYLQTRAVVDYNVDDCHMIIHGRKWFLSPHMTRSEVVQTAFKAVQTAMEHEVRKQFFYRDRTIYDPHYDVDRLWILRGDEDALSKRDPA